MPTNSQRQPVDVVVITALADESSAVLKTLNGVERTVESTTALSAYHGSIANDVVNRQIQVVLTQSTQMGNVAAAQAVSRAIDVWNPQAVLLVGIAGGVKTKDISSLGDVVIADQIVAYEPGKIRDTGLENRWEVYRPSFPLLNAARMLAEDPHWKEVAIPRPDGSNHHRPKVHFGIVASGEKVITATDFVQELQSTWSKLAAVEMEGYGAALATYAVETAPGFLLIKALSDWSNSDKNDNWRHYACAVSAAFFKRIVQTFSFGPSPDDSRQPHKAGRNPLPGKKKIELCRNLGANWRDLADYFDIPLWERDRFRPGWECQEIWEWLQRRNKLDGLPEGLRFILRDDLAALLES
jgi:nucleoside phosphorylase